MSGVAIRRGRRKKTQDLKKEPLVVTRSLAENFYTGVIRDGAFGAQFLEGPNASYVWKSGVKYEGPFEKSRIEGKGRFSWPDGSWYEGELKNGKRHGEGCYMGMDRATKYEGQWCMGKRHGRGKLTYAAEGASYYDGCWCEGEKHGDGHQVWPTGNSYKGQWQNGTMGGRGTMYWRMPTGVEEYTGFWEDNQPHGEGVHTWHAADPFKALGTGDRTPQSPISGSTFQVQQQLNNCYRGQFCYGKREGVGTFYYANGSWYHGEWKGHVKNGQGRHTTEDGTVYEGIFVNDRRVTDPQSPSEGSLRQFSPSYVEDNPICRCTDLSDLEAFAVPSDCSGIPHSSGVGYKEPEKVFREVYNMLLRHLGELKELYSRYRVLLAVHGEDPFVLNSLKIWAFARDFGMLTPACSLARFNRALYSGTRRHREVAPQDWGSDPLAYVRPLSPRSAENKRMIIDQRADELSRPTTAVSPPPSQAPSGTGGGSEAAWDEASLASSMPSPSHNLPPAPDSREFQDLTGGLRRATSARSQATASPVGREPSEMGGTMDVMFAPDAETAGYHQFRRQEGCSGLVDTHSTVTPLLQRQFLEGLVRISRARFPHERGLESQIQRFFKELVRPGVERPPASIPTFGCLVDVDMRRVLDEFQPVLMALFRGGEALLTNPGADGLSPDTSEDQLGIDVAQIGCMRNYGDFGAPQRKLHVRGRLDVTIRVKDFLRLLDSTGLLNPEPDIIADDPFSHVFKTESSAAATPLEGEDPEQLVAEDDMAPEPEEVAQQPQFLAQRPADKRPSWLAMGPRPESVAASSAPEPDEAHTPSASLDDLAARDLRVRLQEVLRVVSSTATPTSVENIRVRLNPDAETPCDEYVSLLEYAEAELIYAEFERLFVCLADLVLGQCQDYIARLPLTTKVESFLRYVFVPALKTPFKPPPPTPPSDIQLEPTKEEEADAPEAGTGPTETVDPAANPEEEGDEEEAPLPEPAPKAEPLQLWRGFDGPGAAAEAFLTPRSWPRGYEQAVRDW
mmetsp:Transcript_106233/g.298759  ORF Transcript_106233/g.298759 Transcript_106233/m.298759 type:complete len:1017 (-) Transcript_106233:111-3161(-)